MPYTPEEAKNVLLEKYLYGEIPQAIAVASTTTQHKEAEVAGPRDSIVTLQIGGSKRPFFFLHGQWTGDAFYCYPLAHALGPDQPFYLLEPYKLEGLQIPPTLETIAATHLKSMRTVQPDGPYLLGGWCNGALVVYEMARQLYETGQTVDLLVLMEPMTLVYTTHLRLFRNAICRFCDLIQLGEDKQFNLYLYLKQGLKHAYRYLRYSDYRRSKDARVPTAEALRQDYITIFDWVAMRYSPHILYPGKTTFIWTDSQIFRKGWRKVEEGKGGNEVEVYYVPGDHTTCRTEYLPVLAECLRTCLSKVQ